MWHVYFQQSDGTLIFVVVTKFKILPVMLCFNTWINQPLSPLPSSIPNQLFQYKRLLKVWMLSASYISQLYCSSQLTAQCCLKVHVWTSIILQQSQSKLSIISLFQLNTTRIENNWKMNIRVKLIKYLMIEEGYQGNSASIKSPNLTFSFHLIQYCSPFFSLYYTFLLFSYMFLIQTSQRF